MFSKILSLIWLVRRRIISATLRCATWSSSLPISFSMFAVCLSECACFIFLNLNLAIWRGVLIPIWSISSRVMSSCKSLSCSQAAPLARKEFTLAKPCCCGVWLVSFCCSIPLAYTSHNTFKDTPLLSALLAKAIAAFSEINCLIFICSAIIGVAELAILLPDAMLARREISSRLIRGASLVAILAICFLRLSAIRSSAILSDVLRVL